MKIDFIDQHQAFHMLTEIPIQLDASQAATFSPTGNEIDKPTDRRDIAVTHRGEGRAADQRSMENDTVLVHVDGLDPMESRDERLAHGVEEVAFTPLMTQGRDPTTQQPGLGMHQPRIALEKSADVIDGGFCRIR